MKNEKSEYIQHPKLCGHCHSPIPWIKRANKYCNHSCAASKTNKIRTLTPTAHTKPLKSTDGRMGARVCYVSFCQSCGYIIPHKRVSFCDSCRSAHKRSICRELALSRNLGGARPSKRIAYKHTFLDSTYEVEVAQSLDAHNIIWTRPSTFSYIDPFGKWRKYRPDFYLPDFQVYLDPKNDFLIHNENPALGFSDKEKISIVARTHNIRIFILDKDTLTWNKILALIM